MSKQREVSTNLKSAVSSAMDAFAVELEGLLPIRQAAIAGDVLFMLVTDANSDAMDCSILAFDLLRGVPAGRASVGYIKFENGGGTLNVSPDGKRVAIGHEFYVAVYDYVAGRFDWVAALEADDQSTCPALFIDSHRIIRRAERRFVQMDLRSGLTTDGPDDERIVGADFVIEADAMHLLATNNRILYRFTLADSKVVSTHRLGCSVIGDPMVDLWNRAYFLSSSSLVQYDLLTGHERIVAEQISPLCMRFERERVAIMQVAGITSIDLKTTAASYQPFEQAIQGAACDESGQFWLISSTHIARSSLPAAEMIGEHVSASCRPRRY